MIRPIVQYNDPILRTPGKEISAIDDTIRTLARDMIETMHQARGVGLAAQQVGEALQLFVLDVMQSEQRPSRMRVDGQQVDLAEFMPMVVINPVLRLSKDKMMGPEGCLSFPAISADVRRSRVVKVAALDLEGKRLEFEAWGLLSRAVQHEYDHTKGILFIDRMEPPTRAKLKSEIQELAERTARGERTPLPQDDDEDDDELGPEDDRA